MHQCINCHMFFLFYLEIINRFSYLSAAASMHAIGEQNDAVKIIDITFSVVQ